MDAPIKFPASGNKWDEILFVLDGYGSPKMEITFTISGGTRVIKAEELGKVEAGYGFLRIYNEFGNDFSNYTMKGVTQKKTETLSTPIDIAQFDISNIDDIQLNILQHSVNSPYVLNENSLSPYGDC